MKLAYQDFRHFFN